MSDVFNYHNGGSSDSFDQMLDLSRKFGEDIKSCQEQQLINSLAEDQAIEGFIESIVKAGVKIILHPGKWSATSSNRAATFSLKSLIKIYSPPISVTHVYLSEEQQKITIPVNASIGFNKVEGLVWEKQKSDSRLPLLQSGWVLLMFDYDNCIDKWELPVKVASLTKRLAAPHFESVIQLPSNPTQNLF